MKTELKIEGMTCGHCVRGVKGALEAVAGVTEAQVTLEDGRALVEHGAGASIEQMVAAVEEEGYRARAVA